MGITRRCAICSVVGWITVISLGLSPVIADSRDTEMKRGTPLFQRIATFPVFRNTDIELETVAEIVASSKDGKTLIYTDSETENLGFVDISDPFKPEPGGVVALGGEPTSVTVAKKYALVAVNTSSTFVSPSGNLVVVNTNDKTVEASIDLGGQPDSVAASPDGRYAAVVIENERDEGLGDGRPPQDPAGSMVIVDLKGKPVKWTTRSINLSGLSDLFPDDPEPEYVDINEQNIAAITLQENNHIILVHLPSGRIVNDWNAGVVDLDQIDTEENDLVEPAGTLESLPREPDGVTWLNNFLLATADEGDLDGGSRGFTIFDRKGRIRFTPGNEVEHLVTRIGHYPEDRSENKGNEPENVAYGRYGHQRLLFVGAERSSVVMVYQVSRRRNPTLLQVLPTGVGPEGLLAIPQRGLFVTASEVDSRDDKIRSALTIYKRTRDQSAYPTVRSVDRPDGTLIPWGALSALTVDSDDTAYSVHDSFYRENRIFKIDISKQPAIIENEIILKDSNGLVAALNLDLVNEDGTVNLDPEGLSVREDGGFWLASEGRGSVDDPDRPVEFPNLLLKVSTAGDIEQVAELPISVNSRQRRFGFEGVASIGSDSEEVVYVAFQREWVDDLDNRVRIGRYKASTGEWTFVYYPIDDPTSPNGGWVGLSELTVLDNGEFAVIERDNQGGTDATIKRIFRFSIDDSEFQADPGEGIAPNFTTLEKTLVRDLLPDLQATGGAVLEKIEGLAQLPNANALIVNDNDGVDDSNGETQLIRIEDVF